MFINYLYYFLILCNNKKYNSIKNYLIIFSRMEFYDTISNYVSSILICFKLYVINYFIEYYMRVVMLKLFNCVVKFKLKCLVRFWEDIYWVINYRY